MMRGIGKKIVQCRVHIMKSLKCLLYEGDRTSIFATIGLKKYFNIYALRALTDKLFRNIANLADERFYFPSSHIDESNN